MGKGGGRHGASIVVEFRRRLETASETDDVIFCHNNEELSFGAYISGNHLHTILSKIMAIRE